MKIDFFTHNPDSTCGSYRIWVRDLSRTLNEIGHESRILTGDISVDHIDSDVVILGKSAYNSTSNIKNIFKNAKIGAINIPKGHNDKNVDFVIVGSPEEMCSMSSYNHVFIYPLIEREFENIEIKKHEKTNKLRICFHGHYPHLAKFEPYLRKAIENVSKNIDIELVIITGKFPETFKWSIGAPKNVRLESHLYNLDTFSDIVKSCDVGVVPNVTDMLTYFPGLKGVTSVDLGLYDTDYFLRFKNKTNGGRAYVFYQHGIPVIHDMSPSSFEFMARSNSYIFAHDTASWEKNLIRLLDFRLRNEVANTNYNTFKQFYNPLECGKKLVEFIGKIQ